VANLGDAASGSVLGISTGGTNNTGSSYSTGKFLVYDGTKVDSSSYDQNSFASPSGANYYVQYYSGGALAGEAAFSYNPSTNTLAVENLNLAAAGNIQVNSTNTKRSIMLTAAGGMSATTSGCASPTQIEFATYDIDMLVMDFNDSATEYAQWAVIMPDNWDASTVTAQFYWTAAAASGNVVWGLQGVSFANSDALDGFDWGTAQTVIDGSSAAYDLMVSNETSAITINGAGAGELVMFRVYRNGGSGNDTLSGDARLIGIKIEYGINAYSD